MSFMGVRTHIPGGWKDTSEDDYTISVSQGYEPLAEVLYQALDQAQHGKGAIRHSNGLPFLQQPIMTGGRECGAGGLIFQARKKALEALNCEDDGRAIQDMLGAINYLAAAVILRREQAEKDGPYFG
jgi:hypothetical protein